MASADTHSENRDKRENKINYNELTETHDEAALHLAHVDLGWDAGARVLADVDPHDAHLARQDIHLDLRHHGRPHGVALQLVNKWVTPGVNIFGDLSNIFETCMWCADRSTPAMWHFFTKSIQEGFFILSLTVFIFSFNFWQAMTAA